MYTFTQLTDSELRDYEQALDDTLKLEPRRYLDPRYSDRNYYHRSWWTNWTPKKAELKKSKLDKIYNFFINYENNTDDIRIDWIGGVESIRHVNVSPGYVYFNNYEAITGRHNHNVFLLRPFLVNSVFVKRDQIVQNRDTVYSGKFIDVPQKLENIFRATNLQALQKDSFLKLVTFYNWCESTDRYAIITTKCLCEHSSMIKHDISFEELYKDALSCYCMAHPNCMLTAKARNKPYRYR